MMKNKISSLYIHIPFCETICDYCDFTKLQYFHNFAVPYIEKLKEEISSFNITHKLKTIFIGGGTPTSLEDDLFENLLEFISPLLCKNGEFTVECNPESLTINKLKIMKKYGVNRISIGVESTNDKILKSINRNHTFMDVISSIDNARELGFKNINIDLILGLPNVTNKFLNQDIDNVISLDVEHISCYGLTVHDHTVFGINNIEPPEDDILRKMYDLVNKKLENAGYIHYEVSNWSKPNKEALHNLTYWKDEQYFGAGLGASGYVGNIRYTNTRNLSKYLLNFNEKESSEVVSLKDDKTYYIMLNLRTRYGINLKEYFERFSSDLYLENKSYFDSLIKQKLVKFDRKNGVIFATYKGMMTLDQIILNLI